MHVLCIYIYIRSYYVGEITIKPGGANAWTLVELPLTVLGGGGGVGGERSEALAIPTYFNRNHWKLSGKRST